MSSEDTAPDRWLDLSEAARILGVHYTTLRRWADAGAVPCMRTPGGRRRFALAELKQFLQQHHQAASAYALVPVADRTLDVARQEIHTRYAAQDVALHQFGETMRERFRFSGQRLLGLLIQFGSRNDNGEAFLEEGRRLAVDYGALCHEAGLSVTDTVRTFLFFSHSMLNAVQQGGSVNDEEGGRLYRRMTEFLDTILLATVEAYSHNQPPAATPQTSKG